MDIKATIGQLTAERDKLDKAIQALQALETMLQDWPGALVVATHDARLRDALRIDRTLEIAPG